MDRLYQCGFSFFRDLGDGRIEMENKFTGLRLVYNTRTGEKTVGECAI